jgi:transcriptional regulator with XRE-family HTH domain
MAKRTRRRPAVAPKSKEESTQVRQALKQLRDYYQLGLKVLEADRKNPIKLMYSRGVSMDFAKRLGVSRDYVDKARQFASKYTEEQLDVLCALRRPDGMPLGRKHVVYLLSVKDKRQRARLQRRAAEEGWATRRLGEEITVLQGSQSSGGRRPRGPVSVDDAVAQIFKMCERWGRWYAGVESEDEGAVSLGDLPKSVSDRLASVSVGIEELQRAAQRKLGRGKR